jgi:hypothetical protein
MELARLSKPNTYHAADIEEDLVNHFGKELYGRLTPDARRYLNSAESLFRQSLHAEIKDYRGSLIDFYEAYRHEFRNRVSGPVSRNLIESGHPNYPLVETIKFVGDSGEGDRDSGLIVISIPG